MLFRAIGTISQPQLPSRVSPATVAALFALLLGGLALIFFASHMDLLSHPPGTADGDWGLGGGSLFGDRGERDEAAPRGSAASEIGPLPGEDHGGAGP